MGKESLAGMAFAAMNGDGGKAQDCFMEYCEENNIALDDRSVNMEKVAKIGIGVCSGDLHERSILDIAQEFGFEATFPAKNEESTIEEELKSLESQSLN